MVQRLPYVNNDDGTWGALLLGYLTKEHYDTGSDNAANGGHKTVTIRPGTAAAGTAPLKFMSGTNMTTAEAGAVEYNGTYFYMTPSGTTRKTVAVYDDSAGAAGDTYYRDSSGNFKPLPIGNTNEILTVSGSGLPSWSSSFQLNDANFVLADDVDTTKKMKFQVSSVSAGATRTLTVPDADTTLVGTDVAQLLTYKTLDAPKINYVLDGNGNPIFNMVPTASATNYLQLSNNATGGAVTMSAQSSVDTNVDVALVPKGAGKVNLFSTSDTPTIIGSGPGGNANLNLTTQGTGVVKANNDEVVTLTGAQTLTNKTITSPRINQIKDSTGAVMLDTAPSTGAVDYLQIYNGNAGSIPNPGINAVGSSTNLSIVMSPKGTGSLGIYEGTGQTVATLNAGGSATDVNLNLTTKGAGVVKANNDEVVTLTGAQTLTNKTITTPVIGAATVVTSFSPQTDDGTALGDASHNFSDLFLASGALINIANNNWVATHSSGILTVTTGDLRVANNFTNATSVVTVGGAQTLTNKTLTAPVISSIVNTGTLTLPTSTDTLVGKNTIDTLTNKTLSSPVINSATVGTSFKPTANDGSALGTATNSFSDLFLATGALINVNNGDWVATHTAGVLTVGTGDLRVTNAGTNNDSVVTVAGAQTLTNKTLTSATFTNPNLGNATATTINKVTITPPATGATLTIPDGVTMTGPAATGTVMTLGNTETVTGVKTFGSAGAVGRFKLAGTTSGTTTLDASATASGTLTLPAATDTLVGKATTDTLTNKTYDTAGAGNVFKINGNQVSAVTGTGSTAVLSTSPTLVTPTLGAASATTINKVTITAPASSATLTIPDGVTLTGPAASGTAMTLENTETVTGVKTFGSTGAVGRFKLAGSTSGTTTLDASATASGTLTLPAATDTLVGKATTDTLTNKTYDTAATGNVFKINANQVSAVTGTGSTAVLSTTPTITDPKINSIKDSGGNTIMDFVGDTSPTNRLYVSNRNTGATPYIGVDGSVDTDIDLALNPKNAGRLVLYSNSNTPTIFGDGPAGNNHLNLITAGTGKVKANGVEVVTLSGAQTLTNKTLTTPNIVSIVNTGTLTLPTSTDTLVGRNTSDTLTNKTMNFANNTITSEAYDVAYIQSAGSSTRGAGLGDNPMGTKLQRAATFSSVTYRCYTADASGNLVVELRKNGTTVAGSSATIAAANQVSGGSATGTWSFAAGDILTVYITGVGTTPGYGLIADLKGVTA